MTSSSAAPVLDGAVGAASGRVAGFVDRIRLRARSAVETGALTWVALAAAMAIAATLILFEGRHQTFFNDDWDVILHRRGMAPGTLLRPENGHLTLVPILIYKSMLEVFGASYVPFRVTGVAFGLLCAALVFVYVRRRVGDAAALAAAVLLLFLGSAWEVLLWPASITFTCGLAAGLGALLMLDRGDRFGDIGACGLLALALATHSIGVAFALAVVLELLLTPGSRRWRRLWVAVLPLALYGLWMLRYGQSQIHSSNIAAVPWNIADSAAATAASLTGLFRVPATTPGPVTGFPPFDMDWGRPIALVAAPLVLARLSKPERSSARLWALVVLLVGFWVSTSLVAGVGRTPSASRYQYPGVLIALLIAAELCRGLSVSARGRLLLAGVLGVALIANIANLRDGASFLRYQSDVNRAELAALELARPLVPPSFFVEGPGTYPPAQDHWLQNVDAHSYFSFSARFGSVADSVSALARSSETAREAADIVLARALGLGLAPANAIRGGPCVELTRRTSTAAITVPSHGVFLATTRRAVATVTLRRFGDRFSVALNPVGATSVARLLIPRDTAPVPWHALVSTTSGTTRLCSAP